MQAKIINTCSDASFCKRQFLVWMSFSCRLLVDITSCWLESATGYLYSNVSFIVCYSLRCVTFCYRESKKYIEAEKVEFCNKFLHKSTSVVFALLCCNLLSVRELLSPWQSVTSMTRFIAWKTLTCFLRKLTTSKLLVNILFLSRPHYQTSSVRGQLLSCNNVYYALCR